MSYEIDFQRIEVPLHWAGQEKPLLDGSRAWACVGCPGPDACAFATKCQRATAEDLEAGRQRMGRTWRGLP